jgi:hypothetical protein
MRRGSVESRLSRRESIYYYYVDLGERRRPSGLPCPMAADYSDCSASDDEEEKERRTSSKTF